MKYTVIAVIFFPLLLSKTATAADGCQDPKTPYDRTYCIAKLFMESDNELNDVYKELKKALSKDGKDKLTASEKEWIVFRDDSCSKGGTINVQCNYDVNRARTEFLRDRARECKTGHCREDLVAQKSWQAPTSTATPAPGPQ